ncbi:MAG: cupin domain-containing protein [Candidatus Amulumruptor caecigallinarius]|nr:cupin domain-containing protein [Candidatus Amulumruptor caecigallinarius]MCM1397832.1 cupin domain-containing protein [Candidatus Amulumruptor caecigallinarius]MCM1454895.1 cupin domain-containing protein [bacterium]
MRQTEYRYGQVYTLGQQIEPDPDKVQFQGIFDNDNASVVLLAFLAGQELTTHTAPAEVMVCVTEGSVEFTMLDTPHTLAAGQFLLMGPDVPHSVKALTDAKVMLIKARP